MALFRLSLSMLLSGSYKKETTGNDSAGRFLVVKSFPYGWLLGNLEGRFSTLFFMEELFLNYFLKFSCNEIIDL